MILLAFLRQEVLLFQINKCARACIKSFFTGLGRVKNRNSVRKTKYFASFPTAPYPSPPFHAVLDVNKREPCQQLAPAIIKHLEVTYIPDLSLNFWWIKKNYIYYITKAGAIIFWIYYCWSCINLYMPLILKFFGAHYIITGILCTVNIYCTILYIWNIFT